MDYKHFVGRDTPRNEYLATLPDTLKTQDIRVEFTTAEGEAKAYLIRKYFAPPGRQPEILLGMPGNEGEDEKDTREEQDK